MLKRKNYQSRKAAVARLYLLLLIVTATSLNVAARVNNLPDFQINAKSIHLDQASRRMVYSGDVRLRHKTMSITGSRAIALGRIAGASKVTVTGQPATARFLDTHGNPIVLSSRSLAYDSATETVVAMGAVELVSSEGTVKGQKMQYELATDLFSVEGDASSPRITAVLKVRNKPVR